MGFEIKRVIFPGGSVLKQYKDELIENVNGPAMEHIKISPERSLKSAPKQLIFKDIDPTMISDKMEIQARKISKPRLVHGSSGHRAKLIKVQNGIAHADEATVIMDD